jgi:hypothetical protein
VAGVCQAWCHLSHDRTLWCHHHRSLFGVNAAKHHQHYNHRAKCIPALQWLAQWQRRYSECVQPEEERVFLLEEKLQWASEQGLAGIVATLLNTLGRIPLQVCSPSLTACGVCASSSLR